MSNERLDAALAKAKKKTVKVKGAPPSKHAGANNTPCRQRYWASGRLQERKVKAIMQNDGCTRAQATIKWLDARKGRMKK